VVDPDATELVEGLRNEIESRFDFRSTLDEDEAVVDVDCRGTRDVETVAGDPRTDAVRVGPETVFVWVSSLSITPNSLVVMPVGEGFVDDDTPLTATLARRLLPFCMGEPTVDVRLEMRGIFVGVSFGRPETELVEEDGGGSFASFNTPFVPVVPTEGEPAIVGSTVRARNELSDCFCMELTVCEVSLEDETVRVLLLGVDEGVEVAEEVDLSRAMRWVVAGSIAAICKGGR
jgi:hypothetical protein